MSVIVETLNIGFIIPLIDFECDLKLTLADKGILSASAFAGKLRCLLELAKNIKSAVNFNNLIRLIFFKNSINL